MRKYLVFCSNYNGYWYADAQAFMRPEIVPHYYRSINNQGFMKKNKTMCYHYEYVSFYTLDDALEMGVYLAQRGYDNLEIHNEKGNMVVKHTETLKREIRRNVSYTVKD